MAAVALWWHCMYGDGATPHPAACVLPQRVGEVPCKQRRLSAIGNRHAAQRAQRHLHICGTELVVPDRVRSEHCDQLIYSLVAPGFKITGTHHHTWPSKLSDRPWKRTPATTRIPGSKTGGH